MAGHCLAMERNSPGDRQYDDDEGRANREHVLAEERTASCHLKQRGTVSYVPLLSTRMQALLTYGSQILFRQKLKDGHVGFAILFIRELAVAAALDRE